jgi:hypothetical protein
MLSRFATISGEAELTHSEAEYVPATIHLLMRFSDKIGQIADTIEAHSDVIKKRGSVWYGKMGKTLGPDKVRRINAQTKKRIPTFLYLIQKAPRAYEVYRGTILEIVRELPTGQRGFVPKYYEANRLEEYIRLWIKLSNLKSVPFTDITKYVISSSGSPALVSLGQSMAALFVIRTKGSIGDPQRPERGEGPRAPRYGEEDDNDPDWDV